MKLELDNTSVIIVTYNHADFIKRCLDSLTINKQLEIIVVDNCSSDSTVETVKKFSSVKLIENENKGYGNGVNLGIKHSKGKYVVILNPDIKVEENAIEELIKPLKNYENIITIPKVLLYDGSKINTCGNVEHFTGLTFTRGLGQDKNTFNKSTFVTGLSGVCFAIKKKLYWEIGGFDETFFLYMEDAELSWKINSLGIKIKYIPDAVIYHDYKLEVSAEKIYHLEKGRYMILRKYFTWKQFLMFLPSILITEIFTFSYASLKGINGLKFKLKAINEGLTKYIEKNNINTRELIASLDWNIPEDQLSYNLIDKIIKKAGNLVYFLNYMLISYFWISKTHETQKGYSNKLSANNLNKKGKMKISLICSHGGHLTEILYLLDAFKDHEIFFITYDNFRTKNLDYNAYLLKNIGTNPLKMAKSFLQMFKILFKERPDAIISTGSEIAIPAFIIAKFLRINTIFIESWCRVKTKSATGKIVYPFSDIFLVQWPELLDEYGKKAEYKGAVI